ncbi:MAG TPA: flagellar biosynthesis protein FlhF [Steroidobacteraceae bacterium]|nr:flagellar biosynthesis protein FlhF [Steroidobacteraceae bacterium]
MKIKTYTHRDMRSVLRQVREEQGPDAVILSSRQLPDGVEVTVGVDPETQLAVQLQAAAPQATVPTGFAEVLARATSAAAPTASPAADANLSEELRTMRHLLERQLSQLAWNDLTRRAPETAELLKELTAMGVASSLAAGLLAELPDGVGRDDAHRRVLAMLTRRINTTGDDLLDRGGRVLFVGPTGVGKTTGIAKLAARWVMRHGTRGIALISLDDQRFGAQEQMRVLGRLLGVECYTLEGPAELPALMARLGDHRLVLVDTAGISAGHRDLAARAAQIQRAAQLSGAQVWLTLSAGAQAGVIGEAMQAFGACAPSALLLTRVDEAVSLGGTLSALAASGLPVAYVSNGTRIPEDLAPARAHQLVARAVFLARSADTSVGEELLVRRFGGVAHAIG